MTVQQATIVGAIIQAIGVIAIGLIVFFAGIYFERQRRRKRNSLEYVISSTTLVDASKLINSPLSVSVDKEFLTGIQTDRGTSIPIKNATAFFVQLVNVGDQAIEQPVIEIRLDDKATIVQSETEPKSRQGYEIDKTRDPSSLNLLRVTPAYISSKDIFSITLLSVENANLNCEVKVFGRDIKLKHADPDQRSSSARRWVQVINILVAIIAAIMVLVIEKWFGFFGVGR